MGEITANLYAIGGDLVYRESLYCEREEEGRAGQGRGEKPWCYVLGYVFLVLQFQGRSLSPWAGSVGVGGISKRKAAAGPSKLPFNSIFFSLLLSVPPFGLGTPTGGGMGTTATAWTKESYGEWRSSTCQS